MKFVLGSKSKRRSELLQLLDLDFYVDAVDADEHIESYSNAKDYATQVVLRKGKLVSAKHPLEFIICADTIVVVDGIILGKPVDKDDARRMMNLLKDKTHEVVTAVYLKYKEYQEVFVETTKVFVSKITDKEIENYINTSEPYDKSGAYAIQGGFSKFVEKVDGDFFNVMGLPIHKLYMKIKEILKKIE